MQELIAVIATVALWGSVGALVAAPVAETNALRVPGFTAYVEPDPDGMQVSAPEGVTG
jgi:hypothetical protein